MRRVLLLVFCMASLGVYAQPVGGGARPQRTRNAKPKDPASANVEARLTAETDAPAATENQENFDEIMGSFSDLAMKFSSQDDKDLDVFVYECKHIGGKAFSQALEPFLSVNGELSDCDDSDLVIISDERKNLDKLKKIAASIDRPVRQVLVSASVVEFQITDGFEKDISLQYNQFVNMDNTLLGTLPGGATSAAKATSSAFATRIMDAIVPSGSDPGSLSGSSSYMYYDSESQSILSSFITFLEENGTAQILSSPSLIMRRGHTGNILSGEDIPITESNVGSGGTSFSVEYKSVGIKLRVTPESIFEDRVVLEVSPEVSNIIRYEDSAAGRNPVIAIRNASTMLELNDGYMVSIGGLLREENIETKSQVPILGSLPIVGALFRASSSESIRSQLVIYLSVKILDPADMNIDTIDASGVPEELKNKVQLSKESLPAKKSSFSGGVKRLLN